MDEDVLDYQLRQLVKEAQLHPPKSRERRKALNSLIKKIQDSGKLRRFREWESLPDFQDIYQEGLNNTLIQICSQIESYNPQHPVMAWVNQLFYCRFTDILRKSRNTQTMLFPDGQRQRVLSLDELKSGVSQENETNEESSLDDFNHDMTSESEIKDESSLRKFIKTDPEGVLQKRHVRNDSNANMQRIMLMLLDGDEWREISKILGHGISTLSSFYQRSIPGLTPYFRRHLHRNYPLQRVINV
ncbi:MAG: hypothetical protein KME49_21990 [Brasilonema octagenarum HA4186-MV1]|jgi:DNA-directed RNA polymerase specialized sigma24 family protein|nr:hypothetical protein [Brasilonema octagenarum HA4186-MV1]